MKRIFKDARKNDVKLIDLCIYTINTSLNEEFIEIEKLNKGGQNKDGNVKGWSTGLWAKGN